MQWRFAYYFVAVNILLIVVCIHCTAQQKADSVTIILGSDTIVGVLYPDTMVKPYVKNVLFVVEKSNDYFTPTLDEAVVAENVLKANILNKYRRLHRKDKKNSTNDRIVVDNHLYFRQYVGYFYKGRRRILVVSSIKNDTYFRNNGRLAIPGKVAGDDYWRANIDLKTQKLIKLSSRVRRCSSARRRQ